MPTLAKQIEDAIAAYIRRELPEEALKIDPNGHKIVDVCFIENDEVDITILAEDIAASLMKETA